MSYLEEGVFINENKWFLDELNILKLQFLLCTKQLTISYEAKLKPTGWSHNCIRERKEIEKEDILPD